MISETIDYLADNRLNKDCDNQQFWKRNQKKKKKKLILPNLIVLPNLMKKQVWLKNYLQE